MSFCGFCGAGIPEGSVFCGQCGRSIDTPFAEQAPEPVSSIADTSPITTVIPIIKSSPHDTESGAPYTVSYTAPYTPPAPEPFHADVRVGPTAPTGRSGPLAGLALLGLIAVAGGIYLVTKSDDKATAGRGSTIAGDTIVGNDSSQTTLPADPEMAAAAQLQQFLAQDRPTADSLVGSWIPQLSAKRVGLKADGIEYTAVDIVEDHVLLREAHGAVLVDAGAFQFTTGGEPMTDWFLTIVPEKFDTKSGAVKWCADRGLNSNNCLARQFKPPNP